MSDERDVRVGSAEREAALQALAVHREAGRLDADEYEDRRGRAGDAVLRRDLDRLFVDLPPRDGSGAGGPPLGETATGTQITAPTTPPLDGMNRMDRRAQRRADRGYGSAHTGRWRGVIALAPFVALGLFLWTGRWWVFLLVPVTAIIVGMRGQDS
jgi:hypothetical protein